MNGTDNSLRCITIQIRPVLQNPFLNSIAETQPQRFFFDLAGGTLPLFLPLLVVALLLNTSSLSLPLLSSSLESPAFFIHFCKPFAGTVLGA